MRRVRNKLTRSSRVAAVFILSTAWMAEMATSLFGQDAAGAQQAASVNQTVRTQRLGVRVLDADNGQPIASRIYLQSASGQAYFFAVDDPQASAVRYEKQNWINKESVEQHTTVSANECYVQVPAGRYTLVVERGKTYRPFSRTIDIGDQDMELRIELKRWWDPAAEGWYSGDTHLHRTIAELRNVLMAEDLNVALPLTSWVTFSDKPPAGGDKSISDAQYSSLIAIDDQHVIWPRNTEYEIFTVGDQRHTLGALFVLGHRENLQRSVPPWKPVIDAVVAEEPDALFDSDKLDWPFAMLLPTLAPNCLVEVANNHVWRTQFAFRQWNTAAPSFMQPPFGTQVGGHRQWLDYTHGMYHTLLNCGLRLPPTAGTANGVHPVPAGFGRVYVHLPGGFNFKDWMAGLKQGRSFVTTGPMLVVTADGHDPGHVFQRNQAVQPPIELAIDVVSEKPLVYGEVLINGRPDHLLRAQNEVTASGAYRTRVKQVIAPERSGWFAVRFWESSPDGQVRFAHTAPWYLEIPGRPMQLTSDEKDYLIDRMRQEMARSRGIVSPEAMEEYQRGLEFYQSLPAMDDSDSVRRNARPMPSQEQTEAWLDNMVLDHQFTAAEVRQATGLGLDEAREAIRVRGLRAPESNQSIRIRPYPGGRHPRRGFLDGAIDPQRETKVSVFPAWKDGGYVVIDVPEAVFSNLGLTYLAHTHIPTLWDQRSETLPALEWQSSGDGLSLTRVLPNGIKLTSQVTRRSDGVQMRLEMTNGTDRPLTDLRIQVCTMLKGLVGFNHQEPREVITEPPFVAIRGYDAENRPLNRWLVTSWIPNHRVWTNPPVPCVHSDPILPNCLPGETVSAAGSLRFYEGNNVRELFMADTQ